MWTVESISISTSIYFEKGAFQNATVQSTHLTPPSPEERVTVENVQRYDY
jgi:hypothetical protein